MTKCIDCGKEHEGLCFAECQECGIEKTLEDDDYMFCDECNNNSMDGD